MSKTSILQPPCLNDIWNSKTSQVLVIRCCKLSWHCTVVRSPTSYTDKWFIKRNQTCKSFKENQIWNLSKEKFSTWNPSMHASLFPFIIFPKLNGVMHAFYFGVVSTQNIPLSRNLLSNWSEVGKVLTTSSLKVINYGIESRTPDPQLLCSWRKLSLHGLYYK